VAWKILEQTIGRFIKYVEADPKHDAFQVKLMYLYSMNNPEQVDLYIHWFNSSP
jgi:hypothetical protein